MKSFYFGRKVLSACLVFTECVITVWYVMFEDQHDIWFNLWRLSPDRPPHAEFSLVLLFLCFCFYIWIHHPVCWRFNWTSPFRSCVLSVSLWERRYIWSTDILEAPVFFLCERELVNYICSHLPTRAWNCSLVAASLSVLIATSLGFEQTMDTYRQIERIHWWSQLTTYCQTTQRDTLATF